MAPFSLSSLVLFGAGVTALVYPWPRETNTAIVPLDAQTPKPTVPAALHHYLRRQNSDQTVLLAPDNTCGYVSGQSSAAYTCVGTTNRCVFVTALDGGYGAAGCCDSFECGFRVTCVDYAQLESSACDASCLSDTFTEKCTLSAAPFCNTIQFPGRVTDYFCNSFRVSTAQLAVTTYPGQVGRTFERTILSDTSTPTRRSSTTTPSHTSGTKTSHTPAASSSSSTPIGAIVGGVVGGVAVLALIAFGIFFIIRRNKKPDPPTPSPIAPETVQHPPPSSFPNPSPGPANLSPSPGPTNLSPSPTVGSKPGHQSVTSSHNPPYPPHGFSSGTPSTEYSGPQFQQQQQFQAYHPPPPNEQGPQDWSQRYTVHPQQQQQPGYEQQGGGYTNPHFSGQSYNVPGSAGSSWPPPPPQQQQQQSPGGYGPGDQGVAGGFVELDGQGRPGRAYELG
ncbi:hypothetical protein QBC39DRAFT_75804 [Podospora conica]|nr:hypothetical protein QBC39DRAFT_75804 [Schizothecium conicum]